MNGVESSTNTVGFALCFCLPLGFLLLLLVTGRLQGIRYLDNGDILFGKKPAPPKMTYFKVQSPPISSAPTPPPTPITQPQRPQATPPKPVVVSKVPVAPPPVAAPAPVFTPLPRHEEPTGLPIDLNPESILKSKYGYSVAQGVSLHQRRRALTHALADKNGPSLEAIAKHIAAMVTLRKRQQHPPRQAIQRWEEDLRWLYNNYYIPLRHNFPWPRT